MAQITTPFFIDAVSGGGMKSKQLAKKIKGKAMKITLSLIISMLLLAGCANDETASPETAATPAASTAMISAESPAEEPTAGADGAVFVEYVWHKEGENFSQEALLEKVVFWNQLIDAGEYEINRANILFPREATENYDFIWVMVWPSVAARNAGWAYWAANDEAAWLQEVEGVFSFDPANAYLFASATQRQPTVPAATNVFENQFNFCTFNDGQGAAELAAYQAAHVDFIQEYEASRGPSGYWYTMLDPTFEPPAPRPDFVWLDLWSSAEEKADGVEYYSTSELAAAADATATCDRVGFAGLNIRS